MWWLVTKKQIKAELRKIVNSFRQSKKDIKDLGHELATLKDTQISKREIDLMIREAMLKTPESAFHTPQTTSQTPQRTPSRTLIRKKADRLLDKAEIMAEIRSMLEKGHTTTEAYDQIVSIRGLCRKTCFFKYLKEVRNQKPELHEQTERTSP